MLNRQKLISWIIIGIIVFGASYLKNNDYNPKTDADRHNSSEAQIADEDSLTVQFIDVGQGDCELIIFPDGRTMLIDAGTTASEETLPSYLKSLGIERLDYVIGTHPHEDHIGGLDAVINSLGIGEIYMPRATATTRTYKDVLSAVQKKGLTINTAKAGKAIIDEENIKATILAPVNDKYDDLNNYSAVVRLEYKNTSFLFTGDAERLSEEEMLNSSANLKSTVLKIGHHGSSTSTSDKFLKAVSPEFAVISCATGNDYGHPHRETVQILNKYNIKTHRTDQSGTITAVSDGNNISFVTVK